MQEPVFFEIPIYRCSLDVHTNFMKKRKDEINESIPPNLYPDSNLAMTNLFNNSIWYPWKYNEIVGYINLHILGSQFRIDLWRVDKKRFNKGIAKKKFMFRGKVLEKNIPMKIQSDEIFNLICEQLILLNKKDFPKFYFDLRTFKIVGEFIDWSSLVDKLNSFKYPDLKRTI